MTVAKNANLSGKTWWTKNKSKTSYLNSTSIDKLGHPLLISGM